MRILVVDDDINLLESICRGLRNKGFQVIEALSAEEALKHIDFNNESSIDLVLADYIMPGMSGIDLLEKVREKSSSLPVIIMTAHWRKQIVIDAMRRDCNSFIEKPFTLDKLVKEIAMVIQV
jgi:DNA-binding NtrC family response regulator